MDKAVSLIFNQKITSKNSFDIETDFFQSLSSIVSAQLNGGNK